MLTVLKNALVYTGIYFIIATVFFWATFFIYVAALVLWKPVLVLFSLLVLIFTWDYLRARNTFTSADAMFAKIRAAQRA